MADEAQLKAAHPDPDVQSVMEKDEELRAVWRALHSLRETDREIILLRDYEELTTTDIGVMLQLAPDAVRQRYSRAVVKLGEVFREFAKNEMLDP